jgi:hypothetical protein
MTDLGTSSNRLRRARVEMNYGSMMSRNPLHCILQGLAFGSPHVVRNLVARFTGITLGANDIWVLDQQFKHITTYALSSCARFIEAVPRFCVSFEFDDTRLRSGEGEE